MTLKKNDIIRLKIHAMSSQGSGIGRTEDNIVVFVPNSAISDELLVRILKINKNIAYGRIESILNRSDDRVESDCPVSGKCGGCIYRHISYDSQLRIKKQKVLDAVERIGKLDPSLVCDIVPSRNVIGYRNKAQIPVSVNNGDIVMGYYAKHSHRIVNCQDCRLSPGIFNEISKTVYSFLCEHKELPYNEVTHKGFIRHLYLRIAEKTGELMVCFVVNGTFFPYCDQMVEILTGKYKQITGIILNVNTEKTNVILGEKNIVLYGREYIIDELCGLKFSISPNSFYQVNRTGAETLYSIAKQFADPGKDDSILDLYCGTGTIGLTMADSCRYVTGIEIVEEAVVNAKKNMKLNGIENADFICADALTYDFSGYDPDIIVVDPPRKGLSPELIDFVITMNPERIVYVSCDPATLSRDLRKFSDSGLYSIKKIVPVDLFPFTEHVESVVLISQN